MMLAQPATLDYRLPRGRQALQELCRFGRGVVAGELGLHLLCFSR